MLCKMCWKLAGWIYPGKGALPNGCGSADGDEALLALHLCLLFVALPVKVLDVMGNGLDG